MEIGVVDNQVDVSRLSVRVTIALMAGVMIITWVITMSAAYTGVQLALSKIDNRQDRTDDRAAALKETVDELKKQVKLDGMDISDFKTRITILEGADRARSIIESRKK